MENKTVQIKAILNGPLQVKGKIKITGKDGNELSVDEETYLCRCGFSKNKPFCDGSHKKEGFAEN